MLMLTSADEATRTPRTDTVEPISWGVPLFSSLKDEAAAASR
jgi:hypothetical protein